MQLVIRAFLVVVVALFLLPEPGIASIIFQAGKAKYVPPGEEEMSGDAAELYQIGQKAEKDGDNKRAIRAYKSLVKRHPKDALAPTALFRAAQLQEQTRQYTPASNSYLQLVERYASSAHFDEAIEGQFRIGEIFLNGKKLKVLGIPIASALDRAVTIFANVVRTAPYGRYTARAQFNIGMAREKQGANDAARQSVVIPPAPLQQRRRSTNQPRSLCSSLQPQLRASAARSSSRLSPCSPGSESDRGVA